LVITAITVRACRVYSNRFSWYRASPPGNVGYSLQGGKQTLLRSAAVGRPVPTVVHAPIPAVNALFSCSPLVNVLSAVSSARLAGRGSSAHVCANTDERYLTKP